MNSWDWAPISFSDLEDKIFLFEQDEIGELRNFWELIKIIPTKWQQPTFGKEGGGFWVVGICGYQIIWYNDIEEGFNISQYDIYGEFEEYKCNQSELREEINSLYDFIKRPW